jgi:thiol-disulfide isomerase/thioredoxin
VLDKLVLTQQPAASSDRRGDRTRRHGDRGNRGDRAERRRDRGNGDRNEYRERRRAERRRERMGQGNGDYAQNTETQTQPAPQTQTAPDGESASPDGGYRDDRSERRRNRGDRGDRRGRQGGGFANVSWTDAGGNRVQLSDFRGRFVVLNLWATWCAPCVTELPALARTKAALANDNVVVIAVDLEKQDPARVAEFLKTHGADALAVHVDQELALMRTFRAYSLPLTILFDKNGREFGRAAAPQPWDHPDAIAYLREMAKVDVAQRNDGRRGDRGDRGDRQNTRWITKIWRWFGR